MKDRIMRHFFWVSAVCKITHLGVWGFPRIHGLIHNELEILNVSCDEVSRGMHHFTALFVCYKMFKEQI